MVNAVNEHLIAGLSGSHHHVMAVLGANLYVANWRSGTVSKYSTAKGSLINAKFIAGLTAPYGLVVATVPEPSGAEMLALGLLGLGLVLRSKKDRRIVLFSQTPVQLEQGCQAKKRMHQRRIRLPSQLGA